VRSGWVYLLKENHFWIRGCKCCFLSCGFFSFDARFGHIFSPIAFQLFTPSRRCTTYVKVSRYISRGCSSDYRVRPCWKRGFSSDNLIPFLVTVANAMVTGLMLCISYLQALAESISALAFLCLIRLSRPQATGRGRIVGWEA